MERTAVLRPKLLRDAVVAKVDRIQLLAILTGKEAAAVERLHLSCPGRAGGGGDAAFVVKASV